MVLTTHLPEVVLGGTSDDPVLRQIPPPVPPRLLVGGQTQALVPPEVRGVQPARIDAVHVHEQIVRHVDGLPLEVTSVEAPRSEHLEEGVVVRVPPHVVQVVVLAPRPDAFLGVRRHLETRQVGARGGPAEEDGLELVHARVGEEQRRIRQRRARARGVGSVRTEGVGGEVINERGSHERCGPRRRRRRRRRRRGRRRRRRERGVGVVAAVGGRGGGGEGGRPRSRWRGATGGGQGGERGGDQMPPPPSSSSYSSSSRRGGDECQR